VTTIADAKMDKRGIWSWCLYDWANSPFTAVVTTFVFAEYFTRTVAPDNGTTLWALMMAVAAIPVAVLGPIFGAVADHGGRRKSWLFACTVLMSAATAVLWWATPDAGSTWMVLIAVCFAVVAFELGIVFYNAMLPDLVSERWIGRVSGWAWALGYFGGLACLVLLLFVFVLTDAPPFGLVKAHFEHVRIGGPIVAVWTLLFAVPIFLFTKDTDRPGQPLGRAVSLGLAQLRQTIREVRKYKQIVRFLIGRMIYMDGVNTLFVFGGIYAAVTFGMTGEEVLMFGILLNVTAGVGAFLFGWMDDALGAKPTILVSLAAMVAFGIPLLLIEGKLWFYILGGGIGLFFGPVQAASRSLMARMAPAGKEAEMFGLYALSGKCTSFIGPLIVGMIAVWANQRIAMSIVIPLIIIGAIILFTVDTKRADPDTVL
jgi:UMF1 family MFS transporter